MPPLNTIANMQGCINRHRSCTLLVRAGCGRQSQPSAHACLLNSLNGLFVLTDKFRTNPIAVGPKTPPIGRHSKLSSNFWTLYGQSTYTPHTQCLSITTHSVFAITYYYYLGSCFFIIGVACPPHSLAQGRATGGHVN